MFTSCSDSKSNKEQSKTKSSKTFDLDYLSASKTGIHFENRIVESNSNNYYFDNYIYNGGGVGIGDINNDGLPDIFFTGNQSMNKLYLNLGDFKFKDISRSAGIETGGWSNGVSFVDINNDGYLDIYVCRGGTIAKTIDEKRNLLFINNKDNTFTEKAQDYRLNDPSLSINSTFFDYDLDGDLDLYITNYPTDFKLGIKESTFKSKNPGQFETDRMYKNNGNGTFSNVTKESGVLNYGHGLGLGAGDFNKDGFTDIYVTNDYITDDYAYYNKGDGTFIDVVDKVTEHTSNFAMGMDIADFNNDGYLDIVSVDMSAEDNFRSKAFMPSMNADKFWKGIAGGAHYQYMRNVLQLNNQGGKFSDIGQMSGISKTDWSWAPLFMDFDNDGWKDLFITNGYLRDLDEKDINKKLLKLQKKNKGTLKWDDLVKNVKSTKLENYFFKNDGNLLFTKSNTNWGMNQKSFSNGAAYGDLDNDGDLDLVVNNINEKAFVIRNNSSNNYLQLKLLGPDKNRNGIGAKIRIKTSSGLQYLEANYSRGYLSSVDHILHFGIGKDKLVEQIIVRWPDGKETVINNVKSNERISIDYANSRNTNLLNEKRERFALADVSNKTGLNFVHKENSFDDYKVQILLPHKMSQFGPHISQGDVNGDGLYDVFVGGANGQKGKLFEQKGNMVFEKKNVSFLNSSTTQEDLGSVFFDADGDGDQDLYVVSGGTAYKKNDPHYQDRLYMNDGLGNFKIATDKLPQISSSGSCVITLDYDKDGDLDLFVGGRVVPDKYPYPAQSYILENINGSFKDVTKDISADISNIGMVTSSIWTDIDGDGAFELIIVGEWMPISIFRFVDGKFKNFTNEYNLESSTGWWNKIVESDLDGDGDMDYIVGNLGKNYKYQASEKEPFNIYCGDLDNNGSFDIVLGYYYHGKQYPVRGLQCSSDQMPFVKKEIPLYNDFGRSTIKDIYGSRLDDALHYEISSFTSGILWNESGKLVFRALPNEAQVSPIFGIVTHDFNNDGLQDILLSGNLKVSEVETGNADASHGLLLLNKDDHNFETVSSGVSGFFANGDVRDMIKVKNDKNSTRGLVLVGNNNATLQSFGF